MNLVYCKHYRKKDHFLCLEQEEIFSAKFKSELVIELLKGEKDLNTIASENNIQPNLLRNWKKRNSLIKHRLSSMIQEKTT